MFCEHPFDGFTGYDGNFVLDTVCGVKKLLVFGVLSHFQTPHVLHSVRPALMYRQM
jgi:hypothetical protein